jgi:hypothetical protein
LDQRRKARITESAGYLIGSRFGAFREDVLCGVNPLRTGR